MKEVIVKKILLPIAFYAVTLNGTFAENETILTLWKINGLMLPSVRIMLSEDGNYSASIRRTGTTRVLYTAYGLEEMKLNKDKNNNFNIISPENTLLFSLKSQYVKPIPKEQVSAFDKVVRRKDSVKKEKSKKKNYFIGVKKADGNHLGNIRQETSSTYTYFDAKNRKLGTGILQYNNTLKLHLK